MKLGSIEASGLSFRYSELIQSRFETIRLGEAQQSVHSLRSDLWKKYSVGTFRQTVRFAGEVKVKGFDDNVPVFVLAVPSKMWAAQRVGAIVLVDYRKKRTEQTKAESNVYWPNRGIERSQWVIGESFRLDVGTVLVQEPTEATIDRRKVKTAVLCLVNPKMKVMCLSGGRVRAIACSSRLKR